MKKIIALGFVLAIVFSTYVFAEETVEQRIAEIDQEIATLESEKEELLTFLNKDSAETKVWEQDYFVDEFDRPTDEQYIIASFDGTFSNSAVNNAKLTVKIRFSKKSISIFLFEYGNDLVKNHYSRGYNNSVRALDETGEIQKFVFYSPAGGKFMRVTPDDTYVRERKEHVYYDDFIDLFRNNKTLSFVITNEQHSTDQYKFTIDDVGNFSELFDATFPQEDE